MIDFAYGGFFEIENIKYTGVRHRFKIHPSQQRPHNAATGEAR